ncbi:hypothetical protein, partial [Burkholderia cenocepacia]
MGENLREKGAEACARAARRLGGTIVRLYRRHARQARGPVCGLSARGESAARKRAREKGRAKKGARKRAREKGRA